MATRAAAREEEELMNDTKTKKKRKKEEKEKGGKGDQAKRPWPSIKAKHDLQINRFKGTLLFTVPNFLSSTEAKAFIKAAESLGFTHQGSLGPAKGEAYRDNDRITLTDPILAEAIWESGLKRVFDDIKLQGTVAVGLNPNIRFYRYKAGQRFGQHIDESVNLRDGRRTRYTLLVYLSGCLGSKAQNDSEPLVGGETVFYDRRGIVAEVAPVEGMALLHIHGDECMLHEARVVRRNVKYVLRSDVVFA